MDPMGYVYQTIMEGNHEINSSMIVGCQRCNGMSEVMAEPKVII